MKRDGGKEARHRKVHSVGSLFCELSRAVISTETEPRVARGWRVGRGSNCQFRQACEEGGEKVLKGDRGGDLENTLMISELCTTCTSG
jgi:hypothetical protein